MKGRRKENYKKSKRNFSKTAGSTHKFNLQQKHLMMRGGIRM